MVKKIIYSDQKVKPLVLELESELLNIKNAISELELCVDTLQNGNNDAPYWNGANAYQFFKSCSAQIQHDNYLLDNLSQCLEFLKEKN